VLSASQNEGIVIQAPDQARRGQIDCEEELLAQRNDPSFKKFISGLASSNSDKSFHLKKQFSHILPPIEENVAENDGFPDEQVDYGSSDESGESSQATDMPLITPGTGILALAAPSTRQEHMTVDIPIDGSQPEAESTQEELASQDNPSAAPRIQQPDVQTDVAIRRSSRVANQGNTNIRIDDKAKTAAEKKDLSGTSLNSSNSFAILDDDDIIARALEMGISHDSFPP
jgi:hypothetical protein